jgi:hypothetical protein
LKDGVLVALTADDAVAEGGQLNVVGEDFEIPRNARSFDHTVKENRSFGPFGQVLEDKISTLLGAPEVSG